MSQGKYTHISFEERVVIENRLKSGESLRRIARCLDRTVSSLSRELIRNSIKVKRTRVNKPKELNLDSRHYRGESYVDKEVALNIVKAESMSLRQMNRYFSSLELLSWFFDGPSLNYEGKIGRSTKFVFTPIACALKALRPEEYELFVTEKGDEILKSYTDICEQVSQIDMEAEKDGSIMSLIDCYNEIFKESTPHYQCAEAFMRATSSLGYSIEVDNK